MFINMSFGTEAMIMQSDEDKRKVLEYIPQIMEAGFPPRAALELALSYVDTGWEEFMWYDKEEIKNFVLELEQESE